LTIYAKYGIITGWTELGPPRRPLFWVGSSLRNLRRFPSAVREVFGYGLYLAQMGAKHRNAKPLKGFGGAGVLELLEDLAGSAYRVVYTIRFADAVYVLHAFQKKTKRGIETPRKDIDLIARRLKEAAGHDKERRRRRTEL
jgi:phage-related protein